MKLGLADIWLKIVGLVPILVIDNYLPIPHSGSADLQSVSKL